MPKGIYQRTPAFERFITRIKIIETGCWEWQGSLVRAGYGVLNVNNRQEFAHRFSYKCFKGEIPTSLQIDHLCRNRACVNPDHLEVVNCRTNILRGISPSALKAKVTHCPYGHPYDEHNTYHDRNGGRYCRACHRVLQKEYITRRGRNVGATSNTD